MDLEWIVDWFPPHRRLNIQSPVWKGRIPLFVYLQYMVNCNVLQTFAGGLHVLRQILVTFGPRNFRPAHFSLKS